MSRNERVRKLANAVRDYRGSKAHMDDIFFTRPPRPSRLDDIKRHLTAFYSPLYAASTVKNKVRADVARIDGFKIVSEFNTFITKFYDDKEIKKTVAS